MEPGDGAAPLGQLSIAELRRRAFSRPTADNREAVDAALRELNRRAERERPAVAEIPSEAVATPSPMPVDGALASVEVGGDEGAGIRSPRRAWRLPVAGIAIAGVLVGALVVVGVYAASGSRVAVSATPTPTASVSEQPPSAYPLTLEQGDIGAAMDWFERAQTNNDWFPDPGTLTSFGIEAGSTRRIADFPPHTAIFVGKTTSGFCLLWATTDSSVPQSTLTCASEEVFARAGLLLQDGTSSYTWNGRTLSSSITPPFND
ncbi:hypothetical protein BH09ACT1_BH09ACT1_16430 [soil metagenome]